MGGDNHFQYAPNPVEWVDPWGLAGLRNPNTIRFSQDSISGRFSDGTNLNSRISALKLDPSSAKNIPPIRLIEFKNLPSDVKNRLLSQGATTDMIFSIDNRRLYVAQQANVDINTCWASKAEIDKFANLFRFTTNNAGGSIRVRN